MSIAPPPPSPVKGLIGTTKRSESRTSLRITTSTAPLPSPLIDLSNLPTIQVSSPTTPKTILLLPDDEGYFKLEQKSTVTSTKTISEEAGDTTSTSTRNSSRGEGQIQKEEQEKGSSKEERGIKPSSTSNRATSTPLDSPALNSSPSAEAGGGGMFSFLPSIDLPSFPSISIPSPTSLLPSSFNFSSLLPKLNSSNISFLPGGESDDNAVDNNGRSSTRRRDKNKVKLGELIGTGIGEAEGEGTEGTTSRSRSKRSKRYSNMNLNLEQATANGETFEDVTKLEDDFISPTTPPTTSTSSFSPLHRPSTLTHSPSSSLAFTNATRSTPINPLTLQSIVRKNSETDALKFIREREERDKKYRDGMAFDKKVSKRPEYTRKTSLGPVLTRMESPEEIGSNGEVEGAEEEEEGLESRNGKERTFSQDTIVQTPRPSINRVETVPKDESVPSSLSTMTVDTVPSSTSTSTSASTSTSTTPTTIPEGSKITGIGTGVGGGSSQIKRRLSLFSKFGRSASISSKISPVILETPPSSILNPLLPVVEIPIVKEERSRSDSGSKIDKGKEREKVRYIKVKTKNKTTKDFGKLFLAQELFVPSSSSSTIPLNSNRGEDTESIHDDTNSQHSMNTEDTHHTSTAALPGKTKNAIWSTKFSLDGRYLAAGGKDGVVRVWEVLSTPEARQSAMDPQPTSPITSTSPISSSSSTKGCPPPFDRKPNRIPSASMPVFNSKPLHEFRGHEADVLDLSWSKNNFLLSSSMDKTVRLWHVSRTECLAAFLHLDFVTSIAFHPKDDRFFLSGSLDCKLRLWNIPEKRVHIWTELPEILTSVAFTGDGKLAIAGNFAGVCMFFKVETFRYHSQFVARSTRGKNSKGKKITSMVPFPLTSSGGERLLVTSNDSRVRLFQVLDKQIEAKYAGHENTSSQIRASFSDDGRYIISGSEDRHVYIWDSGLSSKESGNWSFLKKNQEASYETFQMSTNIITCASFAPFHTREVLASSLDPIFSFPQSPITSIPTSRTTTQDSKNLPSGAQDSILIVADDQTGVISIFRNSTYSSIEDKELIKKGYRRSRALSEFSNS